MKSGSAAFAELAVRVQPETQENVATGNDDVASVESKLEQSTEGGLSDPSRTLLSEFFEAIDNRDSEGVDSAFARMQEAEANAEHKIRNETMYLYVKFKLGDSSAIKRLEKLTQIEESAAPAYQWLAACYEMANDPKRASEAYEKGAEKDTDLQRSTNSLVAAANCYSEMGAQEKGIALLFREIAKTGDHGILSVLYKALASLYKGAHEIELQVLALEKAVEYAPNDTGILFSAAYAFGESDMRAISAAHYRSIVSFDPEHAGAMNNLGVAYQNLKMPIHAVRTYQKAVNLGNTLASANLAYILMEPGFATEAKETLDKAKLASDVHANVGSAIAALAQKNAAEFEQNEKINDSALKQQKFLRNFGDQFFAPTIKYVFAGSWFLSSGAEVAVTQVGEQIIMGWTVEGKEQELRGVVGGNGAIVKFRKMSYGYLDLTVKLGFEDVSKGYALLTNEGSQIEVMLYERGEPLFWELTKAVRNESPQVT
jgi:tetratricopeptide (TPR) repeat protein